MAEETGVEGLDEWLHTRNGRCHQAVVEARFHAYGRGSPV